MQPVRAVTYFSYISMAGYTSKQGFVTMLFSHKLEIICVALNIMF